MNRFRPLAVLALPPPAPAVAADLLTQGAKVGAPIPHDLSATDHAGARQDFRTSKGEKGSVPPFARSVLR